MPILFDQATKLFTLNTAKTTYQMKVSDFGALLHLYYGDSIDDMDMEYLYMNIDRAYAGNPEEVYPDRTISFNVFPQEYTGYGVGDYRINSIALENEDGSRGADFRYVGHEIRNGKYSIPGLPATYCEDDEAETLVITLKDKVTELYVELIYGVFNKKDIITRCARILYKGEGSITLEKAASMSMDITYGKWDLINLHGKHCLERQVDRRPLYHATETVGSTRGTSSHQQNPFIIISDRDTTENNGACFGFMLVYSGGFKAEVELDQFDSVRVVMGIQDERFTWKLNGGECFDTPEVILSYTSEGLTKLSQNYHDVIRNNICRGEYKLKRRPVLLNNWEATYFDFDDEKIVKIAKEAKSLGVELFVLDDGWFGERDSDNTGLGDWFVNTDKIKCGLNNLIKQINAMGLKFGIWIEPEMVSENSDLYRAHPDWALKMPNRVPNRSRNQLVLDYSRSEVVEYIYDRISTLLRENHIEYIKWDMNRSICDVYSCALPKGRQGEVQHRYMLGLYSLMDRLTSEFPHVLFEGCSGGGGRFDAGILYYSPQIWCSDDTDPIQRLNIQYGTSFGYPVSAMGAHVSASPNHQTGRYTSINTRAVVAMSGTFGYELDPGKLSKGEKQVIKQQIRMFKKYYNVIQNGLHYRLTAYGENYYEAWQYTSKNKKDCLLNVVLTDSQPNPTLINLKLKGLDPNGIYMIKEKTEPSYGETYEIFGSEDVRYNFIYNLNKKYTGKALMNAGFTLPWVVGDYAALQIHFQKVK